MFCDECRGLNGRSQHAYDNHAAEMERHRSRGLRFVHSRVIMVNTIGFYSGTRRHWDWMDIRNKRTALNIYIRYTYEHLLRELTWKLQTDWIVYRRYGIYRLSPRPRVPVIAELPGTATIDNLWSVPIHVVAQLSSSILYIRVYVWVYIYIYIYIVSTENYSSSSGDVIFFNKRCMKGNQFNRNTRGCRATCCGFTKVARSQSS